MESAAAAPTGNSPGATAGVGVPGPIRQANDRARGNTKQPGWHSPLPSLPASLHDCILTSLKSAELTVRCPRPRRGFGGRWRGRGALTSNSVDGDRLRLTFNAPLRRRQKKRGKREGTVLRDAMTAARRRDGCCALAAKLEARSSRGSAGVSVRFGTLRA